MIDGEYHKRHYSQEEEFLREFGVSEVLAAALNALTLLRWTPNFGATEDTRRREESLLKMGQLRELAFASASVFHKDGQFSSVQIVLESSHRGVTIEVRRMEKGYTATRRDWKHWRVELMGVNADASEVFLKGLADLGIDPDEQCGIYAGGGDTALNFIKLFADIGAWKLVFGGAASLYLKKWVELFAQQNFQDRKKIIATIRSQSAAGIRSISHFAGTLVAARQKNEPGTSIALYFKEEQLRFELPLDDEDEAIDTLARVTSKLDLILATLSDLNDRVTEGMPATATVDENGFVLVFWDRLIQGPMTQRFGNDGKAVGSATPAR